MLVSGRDDGVRSIFQPTFGFNGGLERSARTRFRGCRFGSLSQSLVSQFPVRPVTINRGQGEHKGRRRVSIGNTLTAEVSLDFIVPEGDSVKVVRLPSFVERRSGELVLRQNINLSKLLLNSLNAPRANRVLGSAFRAHNGHPADIESRHDSNTRSLWARMLPTFREKSRSDRYSKLFFWPCFFPIRRRPGGLALGRTGPPPPR
jgi:hypothetical protein